MSWINRILVPVDFTPCSLAALRYAAFICEHSGAQLCVMHVTPELEAAVSSEDADVPSLNTARPCPQLDSLLAEHPELAGHISHVLVTQGDVAHAIVAAAQAQTVDLIVMGKYGDGGADSSQPGNVLANVAARAPCGVIPVHEPASQLATFALAAMSANDSDERDSFQAQVVPMKAVKRSKVRGQWPHDDKTPRLPHH